MLIYSIQYVTNGDLRMGKVEARVYRSCVKEEEVEILETEDI